MDVKLSPYIIFFMCLYLELQSASATFSGVTLNTDDGHKKCSRQFTACSLKLDGKLLAERGEKGEQGIPGPDGIPGINGTKGEQGMLGPQGLPGLPGARGDSGFNGMPGMPGEKGNAGEKGSTGLPGPPGVKGERGELGFSGINGMKGDKGNAGENGKTGPKGSMGSPGPVGPPGISGRDGICPCNWPVTADDDIEHNDIFGDDENPAEVPCKNAPAGTKSGNYLLGPPRKAFKVFCNMESKETCIRGNITSPELNHVVGKDGFWLSEVGVHMTEIFDITAEQLTWLRDRSQSVRQKLKYNCLDSVPYPKHNLSSSVQLLTWNDAIIGPYPTIKSPLFYSVPPATDECKEGSTEWQSTIIEIISSNLFRLPIADMWIGDIRNADQKMSIEIVELCFG